jgi:hypothetical protein
MIPEHKIKLFDKSILFTAKSVFRVEEKRTKRANYEALFSSNDPVKAIRFYNSTTKPVGFRLRFIKDGDEFIILNKKAF